MNHVPSGILGETVSQGSSTCQRSEFFECVPPGIICAKQIWTPVSCLTIFLATDRGKHKNLLQSNLRGPFDVLCTRWKWFRGSFLCLAVSLLDFYGFIRMLIQSQRIHKKTWQTFFRKHIREPSWPFVYWMKHCFEGHFESMHPKPNNNFILFFREKKIMTSNYLYFEK